MTLILRGSRNASATPGRLPRCLKEGRQRPASALRVAKSCCNIGTVPAAPPTTCSDDGQMAAAAGMRQGTFREASTRWGVSATQGVCLPPPTSEMLTRTARLGAYCLGLDQLDPDELVTRPGLNGSCGGPIKR